MIIRRYWFMCENCGQDGRLVYQESFPEVRKCPRCQGRLRIQGVRDFSSTQLAREQEIRHVRQ